MFLTLCIQAEICYLLHLLLVIVNLLLILQYCTIVLTIPPFLALSDLNGNE